MKIISNTVLLICLLILTACSSNKEEKAEADLPAEQLYNEGMDNIHTRDYKVAIEKLQRIENLYPYSKWSTKGKIMAAYASYRAGEYEDAIIMLDNFIKVHPANEDTPYAYYLRALSYYDRIVDIGRDQKITEQAFGALNEVTLRFPESEYARDAKLKLDLVTDHLAGKEMEIGRFYQQRDNCIGAINRFKRVVDKYQTTSHTPEALHRLAECYTSMGVMDEAQKYASVLGHNFPNSKWYKRSYELVSPAGEVAEEENKGTKSWLKRIF